MGFLELERSFTLCQTFAENLWAVPVASGHLVFVLFTFRGISSKAKSFEPKDESVDRGPIPKTAKEALKACYETGGKGGFL